MAVKIRLCRIGTKKRPFYRVVAVDERKKRTGKYIELLGTYNPLTEPKEIILKKDRIDWWLKNGAVCSYGYLRIIKEAPPKLPRKPKKEKIAKVKAETKPQEETPQEKQTLVTEEVRTENSPEVSNDSNNQEPSTNS